MLGSVFAKTIWDRRRSLIWWIVGMLALTLLTVAFWPSIRDTDAFGQAFEGVPEEMLGLFGIESIDDLFSPAGYVNSQLYSNVVPIALAVFGIGAGTAAVAGEEDRRTIDMLLAQPVSRRDVVVQQFAAMAVLVGVMIATIWIGLVVTGPMVDLGLSAGGLLAANLGAWLLVLWFAGLALLVGAATGKRGLTIGIASGVTVAAFFINGLAPLVDALEWSRNLSPFDWYLGSVPLENGVPWGDFGLLAGFVALFLVAAVWAFDRRDVAV